MVHRESWDMVALSIKLQSLTSKMLNSVKWTVIDVPSYYWSFNQNARYKQIWGYSTLESNEFTLQWRQFCAFIWSFGSPFSSETYLHGKHGKWWLFSKILFWMQDFNLVMKTQQGIATLRTHRLGLDSNVILVQHTEGDLHFQVS
jgi:hypothetical protein